MLTLALIGLVGGLITGVSPCVLPMLPIIFFAGGTGGADTKNDATAASTTTRGGAGQGAIGTVDVVDRLETRSKPPRDLRPLKIIAGLVISFSLFTLLGSTILAALGLPDSFLRWAGLTVLGLVGLGLVVEPIGHLIEKPFYRLPKVSGGTGGPFVLGLGLGTLYVPCAGPILAAITVAGATGHIGWRTVVLTVTFATGAALPLLVFASAGSNIRRRINAYRSRAKAFRIAGGVVMIALAIALAFNATDALQRALPDYTAGLQQKVANSSTVQGALTPFATKENKELSKCSPGAATLASCGPAPALRDNQQWFNTPGDRPLTLSAQKGKVVLLDFFAYSCINCQRDQPYIEKWYDAYKSFGLQVIGVHSPEFAFEKSAGNLESSLRHEGTTYPVVQDNDLATWTAYRNSYWPAKYLIDPTGTVRAIKFGEGDYEQTEGLIRQLLQQLHPGEKLPAPVTDVNSVPTAASNTPETYLSPGRGGYSGSPAYVHTGTTQYTLAGTQALNTYSLGGSWKVGNQSITSNGGSRLRLHFTAKDVYNVLSGKGTVTVAVPGEPDRVIHVSGTPNLYPIVQGTTSSDQTVTLTYSKGLTAFTFSFG
jgi:cytochrome c biogenesis protein CcdA/thiol-disulfide isomerase/thioredoxin